MKKALILIVGLLLLASSAIAENQTGNDNKTGTAGADQAQGNQPEDAKPANTAAKAQANGSGNKSGPVMTMNGTQAHAGLYNALGNVENEQARAAIQRNMERFMERYQERLGNMTNVEVDVDEETGEVQVKAKEQVKYLGFIKGKATKRFEIQNNGQVTEKQPWYRFLYAEQKPE